MADRADTLGAASLPLAGDGESLPAAAGSLSSGLTLAQRATYRNSTASRYPPPKRRSSILSEFSLDDAQQTIRSSTDSILLPRPSLGSPEREEPSHWHSAPLVFAILPAIAGLLFKNGSAFMTDVLLLGLAAIFLNWSVRVPWKWYHDACNTRLVAFKPAQASDTNTEGGQITEEDSDNDDASPPKSPNPMDGISIKRSLALRKDAAALELRYHELLALSSCFVSPLLSAYLLHVIRSQLSRPSEGLVSDYNLTIFLLMAELRPCAHLVKMMQARTLHLQRFVQASEPSEAILTGHEIQDLSTRMDEIEASLASALLKAAVPPEIKAAGLEEAMRSVRQSMQPQLDALNRAVRRYEKRATTQTMVTEARLQDLEHRLQDALSLAAVAAQSGQKPSVANMFVGGLRQLFMFPFQAIRTMVLIPLHFIVSILTRLPTWLFGSYKGKRRKPPSEHVNASTPRVQMKSLKR